MQDPHQEVALVPPGDPSTHTSTDLRELSPVPQPRLAPLPIEVFIAQAIDKGQPVETIEKFLAMRREIRAEAAKEAFDQAMAKLQGEMPTIRKSKVVYQKGTTDAQIKAGTAQVRYAFAPIDAIIGQTKAFISRHGFSYAITTEQSEVVGEVKAICTVKHELGHSEGSTFRVPIDKDGFMTAPQKVGAALTFAKRYAFCNAFGIITGDMDNDAQDLDDDDASASRTKTPQQQVGKPPQAPKTAPSNAGTGQVGAGAKGPGAPAAPKPLKDKDRPELMKELHALLAKYGMPREAMKAAYKVDSMDKLTDENIRAVIVNLRERTKNGGMWEDPNLPKVQPSDEITDDDIRDLGGKPETAVDVTPPPPPAEPTCATFMLGKPCGRPMPCAYHPVKTV